MTFTVSPDVGERLLALRDQHELSGTEVAKRAGINPSTYYNLENNIHKPRHATMRRLARAYGVSHSEFMQMVGGVPLRQPISPLTVGEAGAGDLEDEYVTHFAGGDVIDAPYEDEIADAYLRLFRDEGSTDEAFKLAVKRAMLLGKQRGRRLA